MFRAFSVMFQTLFGSLTKFFLAFDEIATATQHVAHVANITAKAYADEAQAEADAEQRMRLKAE